MASCGVRVRVCEREKVIAGRLVGSFVFLASRDFPRRLSEQRRTTISKDNSNTIFVYSISSSVGILYNLHHMTKATTNMKFSFFFFFLMSMVQSFVTRRLVAGSKNPLAKAASMLGGGAGNKFKHGGFPTRASSTAAFSSFLSLPLFNEKKNKKKSTALFSETLTTAETDATSATSTATKTKILADASEFIKPDRDTRQYRYIKLANNLEVMLVSTAKDSDDEKSEGSKVEAASVHVQAGHFDDTIPGLAHFHEHMLVRMMFLLCCYRGISFYQVLRQIANLKLNHPFI